MKPFGTLAALNHLTIVRASTVTEYVFFECNLFFFFQFVLMLNGKFENCLSEKQDIRCSLILCCSKISFVGFNPKLNATAKAMANSPHSVPQICRWTGTRWNLILLPLCFKMLKICDLLSWSRSEYILSKTVTVPSGQFRVEMVNQCPEL